MRLIASVFALFVGLISCSAQRPLVEGLLLEALLAQGVWQTIYPGPGSFSMALRSTSGTYARSYSPICSGRPGTNPSYAFLVKRGSSSNLLINFMGGGACWSGANCLGPSSTITYYPEVASLMPATLAVGNQVIDQGILNHNRSDNPFQTWNMVFVSYCSGDIHVGSADTVYADPQTGVQSVIHHHGVDNTLSVLSYLQAQFPESSVSRVFITGQSAGGYGAIFNYPLIKEMYYSRQVDVLGDAANGVLDVSDTGAAANQFQQMSSVNWNATASVPSWIPTINGQYLTLSIGDFYNRVATYYESGATNPAPGKSKFAQYTAAYDGNQRFFFGVMRNSLKTPAKTYTTTDNMWGRTDGYDAQRLGSNPALNVSCNWNTQMRAQGTLAATSPLYKRVVAAGSVHTISMSNSYYTTVIQTAGGNVRLVDWYNSMLTGSGFADAICAHAGSKCSAPNTEESTPLNCTGQPGFNGAGDGW